MDNDDYIIGHADELLLLSPPAPPLHSLPPLQPPTNIGNPAYEMRPISHMDRATLKWSVISLTKTLTWCHGRPFRWPKKEDYSDAHEYACMLSAESPLPDLTPG